MIFFISPNPHTNSREGFLQRIYAIDSILNDPEKIYIDDLKSESEVLRCLIDADIIYIHSMYQADRIKDYLHCFGDKIIVDLHGVVPEELEYLGDIERAAEISKTEKLVFENAHAFVAVTEAMVKYYKKKYHNSIKKTIKWIVLPIFDSAKVDNTKKDYKKLNTVYAGGSQKWQSVDTMISVMKHLSGNDRFGFTILTHNLDAFRAVADQDNVKLVTVKPDEVTTHYENATLGFVLRDKSVVNLVACPTKLIEYFEHGIVPVVDNAQIGDFDELGYRYVHYKDLNEKLSIKSLEGIAVHNRKVIAKILKISDKGKQNLVELVNSIKATYNKDAQRLKLIDLLVELTQKKLDLQSEVESSKHESQQKAKELALLKQELHDIKNSKKWRLISKAAKLTGK